METDPCRICLHTTRRIEDEPFGIDYFHCPRCDFIFVEEGGVPTEEEQRQEYRKHDNTRENAGYVSMLEAFVEKCVSPYRASVSTVLDFGCGPGPVLAELLQEAGYEVDLFDPLFFPDKTYRKRQYDLITATEVIEHLRDPMESFKHLKEVLRGKGKLAVMTLFHPGDAQRFKTWWYRREASHISFYSRVTIEYMARELGMNLLMTDDKSCFVLGT